MSPRNDDASCCADAIAANQRLLLRLDDTLARIHAFRDEQAPRRPIS